MHGMYISLCMVIIRNYVHGVYSSFLENIKLLFKLRVVYIHIYIVILAGSNLSKCLKAIKCSKSRVGDTPDFFYLFLHTFVTVI